MREKDLKAKLDQLPERPGIYFFLSAKGEIIYIGKARSLKDRIKSYFGPAADFKTAKITAETADIDFILTGSEKEAAFLENNFVQRYQPRFNLRLKDDKSFPYLKLTTGERFPGVHLTRKVAADGAKYFGPFSPASQARKTIHLLNRYFGIRGCEESIPGKRRRPCLEYDLKLCSAPCVGITGETEYRENVANSLLFLEGKTDRLVRILKEKMRKGAESLDYEQAAHWRDLIRTIEQIKERPRLISVSKENMDIFGYARQRERISLYAFLMRKGKVIEAQDVLIRGKEGLADAEALGGLLQEFYEKRGGVPDKILLPLTPSPVDGWLDHFSSLERKKIKIIIPQKGKNKQLVELANRNAELLLETRGEELPALTELARILGLEAPPQRIEGFDISNTGGDESVGSLVVFEKGHPKKAEYRKYRIKTVSGPNDVDSLREVIYRRYFRAREEKGPLPGLVLVDGGKGQYHAAEAALRSLGLESLPLVSLAKREEIVFTGKTDEGIRLDRTSPALRLLQFIRDEAHRFAISFHRKRRAKKSFASELDGIPGLGEKRKKALLARYGSIAEIRQSPLRELAAIVGSRAAGRLKEEKDDYGNRD